MASQRALFLQMPRELWLDWLDYWNADCGRPQLTSQVANANKPRSLAGLTKHLMHNAYDSVRIRQFNGDCKAGTIHYGIVAADSDITIYVADNGGGLDDRIKGNIFDSIDRNTPREIHKALAPFRDRVFGGEGMALQFVADTVRSLGGHIGYFSASDGAIFWFQVPITGIIAKYGAASAHTVDKEP